jgi:hypothetical protein
MAEEKGRCATGQLPKARLHLHLLRCCCGVLDHREEAARPALCFATNYYARIGPPILHGIGVLREAQSNGGELYRRSNLPRGSGSLHRCGLCATRANPSRPLIRKTNHRAAENTEMLYLSIPERAVRKKDDRQHAELLFGKPL